MKKNILIMILIMVIGFTFIGISKVYADSKCSSSECYCDSSGNNCSLLRNPRGIYTTKADKSKCGCREVDTSKITSEGFCEYAGTLRVFKILGIVLFIIKIIVPIILIIMGMVSFGKATISGDQGQIKSSVTSLIKKAIAAVVVFLVPYVINAAFSLVDSFSSNQGKFVKCTDCLKRATNCDQHINTAVVKGNE